jgi:hypothetical protein
MIHAKRYNAAKDFKIKVKSNHLQKKTGVEFVYF